MQGIFGGTFDPPHLGHLEVARTAYDQLGLESVRLMPAGDPWQKEGSGVGTADDRWAMTVLLADEEPWLEADDTEVNRAGPSYTIDTVSDLGEKPFLILGADAALGIESWHRGDDLLEMVNIAVVPRDGVSREQVEAAIARSVVWLDMPPVAVSSSAVRAAVALGEDIRGLVPAPVADYVDKHGLYQSSIPRHRASLSSTPMNKTTNKTMKKATHGATPDAIQAARKAAEAISDKGGENLILLDLSGLLVVTDVFVLATGTSRRNVLTLVDEAVAGLRTLDREPIRKEGTDHGKWVLLDYGDVVVHVFDRETREYYDIERLWSNAPRIDFEPSPSTAEV